MIMNKKVKNQKASRNLIQESTKKRLRNQLTYNHRWRAVELDLDAKIKTGINTALLYFAIVA